MNKRNKMIGVGIGIVFLMVLVNFAGLVSGDTLHQNFSEWGLTSENDSYNLKEIDSSSDNNYRNYYQLATINAPFIDSDETQNGVKLASTNSVNYAFVQNSFEYDNNSFLKTSEYFNATYTTKSELQEFIIDYTLDPNCYISFLDNVDYGKSETLRLQDSSNSGHFEAIGNYTTLINGTIEFSFLSTDSTYELTISLSDGVSNAVSFGYDNDLFGCFDGGFTGLIPIVNYNWYHIRVDFDCLSDTYDLYFNNIKVKSDSFLIGVNSLSKIYFVSNDADTIYNTYFDSFGVYNEYQEYQPILTEYLGTQTFNESLDGSWNIDDAKGVIEIVSEYDDRKNVLKLQDTSSSGYVQATNNFDSQTHGSISFYQTSSDVADQIRVEISGTYLMGYVRMDNDILEVYSSSGWETQCGVLDDTWYHLNITFENGLSGYDGLGQYEFNVYLNNTKYGTFGSYGSSDINKVTFLVSSTAGVGLWYIDALDYSWSNGFYNYRNLDYEMGIIEASEYQIGDNYYSEITNDGKEILLVNFEIDGVRVSNIDTKIVINESITSVSVELYDFFYSDYTSETHQIINPINMINQEIRLHLYFGLNEELIYSTNYKLEIIYDKNESTTQTIEYSMMCSNKDSIALDNYHYYRSGDTVDLGCYIGFFNNDLRGIRLVMDDNNTYNSFVDFPLFDKSISIRPIKPDDPVTISGNYWVYTTYIIQFWYNDTITVGEISVDYNMIQVSPQEAKFYYRLIGDEGLVNWGFFGEWNWLRDALIWVVNILVMIPIQFLLFCLTVAFNFIIMFLIIGSIVVFFWNVLLRGIIYLGLLILWILWSLLMVIWALLQVLYETVLVPLFTWLFETGIPLIVNVLIMVLSVVLASFIWLISMGNADYVEIYNLVVDLLEEFGAYFVQMIQYVLVNIPIVLFYAFAYVVLVGFIYLKYMYAKARGYRKRAESLYQSYQTYLIPINACKKLVKGILDVLPIF